MYPKGSTWCSVSILRHIHFYHPLNSSRCMEVWSDYLFLQRYDSESSSVPKDSLRQQFSLQQSHQQSSVSWAPQCKFLSVPHQSLVLQTSKRRCILTSPVMSNGSQQAFFYPHEVYFFALHIVIITYHCILKSA